MRYIMSIIVILTFIGCETKYNIIDTGLANGNFKGNMYEFLKNDSYNWDSIRLIIERAELVDLFEGQREGYEQITFFGPVNHSIRRWMIENDYDRVRKIPLKVCREMVMRHIVRNKRLMLDDIPLGTHGNGSEPGNGGMYLTGEMGNQFWIYTFQGSYNEVPGIGALEIHILSRTGDKLRIDVATCNLETTTGTVMALNGTYIFGTL